MVSSAVGFMKYGVGNGIACIVIGLILLSFARSSGSGSDSGAASPAPESSVPETQKIKSIEFPIAGVTFENESGKLRSRQSILRKILFKDPPYDSEYEVRLERYFYNDSPAYYVYAGEYVVGNVPKEFVPYLEENIDRRYVVDYFHVYGGGQGKNFGAEMKIKYIE